MLKAKCGLVCGLVVTLPFIQSTASAQQKQSKKQAIKFFGRVEAVDAAKKTVTVKHGKIPGYMDAMTMDYSVEEEGVLKALHAGDDFRAIVSPDDLTLHQVKVVGRDSGKRAKSSK
jgi:Cu/Ag efflux protein CusF